MGVEDGGNEVKEVNREGEIGNQLGPGDEKQKKNYAGNIVSPSSFKWICCQRSRLT